MITDEISNIFEYECSKRGICRVKQITGLKYGKIYNIINGCNFVINPEFIAALNALGYQISIEKK